MRLLILTRKIDHHDSRASFVSDWLLSLAQNLETLVVICQEIGDISGLPENIKIYSLGKEKGYSKIRQFLRAQKLFIKLIKDCQGIFVHQMPIYSIIIGPWAKLFRQKLIQWYTHKSVDWRLCLANIFIDEYVSASQTSFRLKTKKPVHIFGHGININKFKIQISADKDNNKFNIISIGRISPSKDYESMIKAVFELQEQGINNLRLIIIGDPAMATGHNYFQVLQTMVENMKLSQSIKFIGGLPQNKIIPYLQKADLFINLSNTGSLDNAILEAMSCGCLVLTSNVAYKNILPPELFTTKDDPTLLAERIKKIIDLSEDTKLSLSRQLRQEVIEHHNLESLIFQIIRLFKN